MSKLTLEKIKTMTKEQLADQIEEVREVMDAKYQRDEARSKPDDNEDEDILGGGEDNTQNTPLTVEQIKQMSKEQIAGRMDEVRQVMESQRQIN